LAEIYFTEQFHNDYKALTSAEQVAIKRALNRLKENMRYPSLRVKKMKGRADIWEASPSRELRITFRLESGIITMRTCGHHDDALGR
jgi:mRNA-degrading endonuclease RelE of RelBE toxin-antitoxin system